MPLSKTHSESKNPLKHQEERNERKEKQAWLVDGAISVVVQYTKKKIEYFVNDAASNLVKGKLKLTIKPSIVNGALHFPFNCDPKYHWWKEGGMSMEDILFDIRAPKELFDKYRRKQSGIELGGQNA